MIHTRAHCLRHNPAFRHRVATPCRRAADPE